MFVIIPQTKEYMHNLILGVTNLSSTPGGDRRRGGGCENKLFKIVKLSMYSVKKLDIS